MVEHRLAKLAAAATFLLLVIGGTVNPTGSSLACPEPTLVCHGQLFPPMVGGVLYEHGHRLAAMTVGLLQIALTFLLFTRNQRLMVVIGMTALGGSALAISSGLVGIGYPMLGGIAAISLLGVWVHLLLRARTPQAHDAGTTKLAWILLA